MDEIEIMITRVRFKNGKPCGHDYIPRNIDMFGRDTRKYLKAYISSFDKQDLKQLNIYGMIYDYLELGNYILVRRRK